MGGISPGAAPKPYGFMTVYDHFPIKITLFYPFFFGQMHMQHLELPQPRNTSVPEGAAEPWSCGTAISSSTPN